ncbi:MAG: TIGR04551 family protein, partial [Myxococcaceae bacterium]|nr:TIGR04551 family protein [Myxococcaceae bacterium]
MSPAALAALCVLTATAPAQTPPASEAAPTAQTAKPPASEAESRALEEKLEEAKKELREEIRAQLATQQAASGFDEGLEEQAPRQLELLTLDGYLRARPKLFVNFDLDRQVDSSGFTLFPTAPGRNTQAFADMRLRLDPTLNISEEVAIKMQVDVLDNVVFGSTPESG